MIGDKLVIEQHHTERAVEICDLLADRIKARQAIQAITCRWRIRSRQVRTGLRDLSPAEERGIKAGVLQQDDYFVFPPRTNHEMRRSNLEQVGPFEVKLDFLDSNLRSFKRGESPIYKPLVDLRRESHHQRRRWRSATWRCSSPRGPIPPCCALPTSGSLSTATTARHWRPANAAPETSGSPLSQDVLEREHQIIAQHKLWPMWCASVPILLQASKLAEGMESTMANDLVQGCRFLRGVCPGFCRRQRRRHRRPAGPDLQARLSTGPGRGLHLAAAHLSLAAARRWLRRGRLLRHPS